MQPEGNFTHGCIMGMHGVSGSGKSTLCNFLCNFMFNEFMGKVIRLELTTKLRGNDDPSIVVKQYANLLSTIRPHERNKFESMDLLQLYNLLLQNGAKWNHKMFLILDNISKSNYKSYETMLKAILRSAILGSGSRVMLVAQSRAILENLLKDTIDTEHVHARGSISCYSGKLAERYNRYRYAIMEMPCLTKEEVMKVITHNCHSSVPDDVIPHLLEKRNFPSSTFIYVPFVFEHLGILLRNKCDSECLKELELFCKTVDECKQEAIQKLVDRNFQQLREDLQVLLFDVTLFIIPVGYSKLSDAIPILCSMHDVMDIKMKINELVDHRALSVTDDGEFRVHDIYVEYARRIPRNSKVYVDEPHLNISGASITSPITLSLKYRQARTINIGPLRSLPHRHYDEICPHVEVRARDQALEVLRSLPHHYVEARPHVEVVTRDQGPEVRLDVEVGASTAALFVRNSCRYCKCMLGLSGDLSSLVCFRIENVRLVASSPSGCNSDLSKLLRLELRNASIDPDIRMRLCSGDMRKRVSMFLDFMGIQIQNTKQSMRRWLWKPLLPLERWHASDDEPVRNFLLGKRMSQLRVLILNNAGIRRLENIGVYCPQLEVLEFLDDAQYEIHVSLGNAPKLKRLVAGENGLICGYKIERSLHYCPTSGIYYARRTKLRPTNSRRLILHLDECPELEQVYVDGSFDQFEVVGLLPSNMRNVAVDSDRCLQSMLGELITTSISTHRLSLLETLRLTCKVVKTLNFKREYLGCLHSLKELILGDCQSLTHLSVESCCMPNLVRLDVYDCAKLEVIEEVQQILLMQQLETLYLAALPRLQAEFAVGWASTTTTSDAGTTTTTSDMQLFSITVYECPHVTIDLNGLMHVYHQMWTLDLKEVGICRGESDEDEKDGEKCANADDRKALRMTSSAVPLDRLTFLEGRFSDLRNLDLRHVSHLVEIEGFQHLPNLQHVHLSNLPDHARVSGRWPSTIQCLSFASCPMLQEILLMEQTPKLYDLWCIECTRLRGVEGRFGEMKELSLVRFIKCESMKAFPMQDVIDDLGERRERGRVQSLFVYGSKFPSVELMRTWLRDAEFGSCLFEAAMYTLRWEHVAGTPGAMDAIREYLFALVLDDVKEDDWRYLHSLIFPSYHLDTPPEAFFTIKDRKHRGIEYHKKPKMKQFEECLLSKFPHMSIYNYTDIQTHTFLESLE